MASMTPSSAPAERRAERLKPVVHFNERIPLRSSYRMDSNITIHMVLHEELQSRNRRSNATARSPGLADQRFGLIFAAKDWATIFPFRTTNVSVANSYELSAVSAVQTMYACDHPQRIAAAS
jgi:hypothetical protein